MQYLYRALNSFDMEIEPFKNGLISKKIIGSSLESFYAMCFYHTKRIEEIFNGYENVTEEIYKSVYNSLKHSLVKGVLPLIVSKAYDDQRYIDSIIQELSQSNENVFSNSFKDIASTIQTHLCKGSSYETEWISFSKSLESIRKFYLTQEKHEVAVIQSNVDRIFDYSNWPPLIAFDVSSREKIAEIAEERLLINKKDRYNNYLTTNLKSRGFNYSVAAEEVIYYSQVPREQIIALLKPLEVDLLLNDALDLEFYVERREQVGIFYQRLLLQLEKSLINDVKMQYVFENHFKNQIPINSLGQSLEEREELCYIKKLTIAKAFSLDNRLILKPTSNEIKIMEQI